MTSSGSGVVMMQDAVAEPSGASGTEATRTANSARRRCEMRQATMRVAASPAMALSDSRRLPSGRKQAAAVVASQGTPSVTSTASQRPVAYRTNVVERMKQMPPSTSEPSTRKALAVAPQIRRGTQQQPGEVHQDRHQPISQQRTRRVGRFL